MNIGTFRVVVETLIRQYFENYLFDIRYVMGSYERVFIQEIFIVICQVLRVGRGIAWLLVNVIGQKDHVKNDDPQAPFSKNLQLLYENYATNFTTQVGRKV